MRLNTRIYGLLAILMMGLIPVYGISVSSEELTFPTGGTWTSSTLDDATYLKATAKVKLESGLVIDNVLSVMEQIDRYYVGSIIPFAVPTENMQHANTTDALTTPDMFWLLCDGSEYNLVDFPELAEKLGVFTGSEGWGASSAPTTKFKVPDLRGLFLKGVAATANIGVEARDSFVSHTHNVDTSHSHSVTETDHSHGTLAPTDSILRNGAINAVKGGDYDGGTLVTWQTSLLNQTDAASAGLDFIAVSSIGVAVTNIAETELKATETRPTNVALYYWLRAR